jgi:hypothetical protein
MKKQIAGLAVAATILGGAGGAYALLQSGSASADTSATTTTAAKPAKPHAKFSPGDREKKLLDPLVKNGTINQKQEDAVIKALDARPKVKAGTAGGRGGFGFGGARGMLGLDEAALTKALGVDAKTLQTDIGNGQSIADIAKAKGVDINLVINAIVTANNAKIEKAVTDKRLTQTQADKITANEKALVSQAVNAKLPAGASKFFGQFFGGKGGPGGGRFHGDNGNPPSGGAPAGYSGPGGQV